MRLRSILAYIAILLLFVACTVQPPDAERLGRTSEELIAKGQRCLADSQCKTGHCVDTVCCDTACGGGARDTLSCSNIYGNVPGLVDGTCTTLVEGNECGALTSFNPCKWKGGVINHGGQCNAPDGTLEVACQACVTSADCPSGLPVCVNGGCTACTADFGVVSTTACPTAAMPACVDSACVECSSTNSTACTGNKGSCDTSQNICVGCTGDFGSAATPENKFPCGSTLPACITSGPQNGSCGECSDTVACTKDPNKKVCDSNVCVNCVDSSTCPDATPVCTNKQCVQCNGNHTSGATSACPTTTKPACVPSANGPGTCEQCSASDATACAGTATPVCDTASSTCVECNPATAATDCTDPSKPFCNNHICTAQCTDNTQCPGQFCKSGFCVGCIDDTSCPGGFCGPSNTCIQCRTSADCGSDPTKPVCSTVAGTVGTCVACAGDNASGIENSCPSTTFPACNPDGKCVTCNSDNTKLCDGTPTPACSPTTFECVQCNNNSTCVGTSSTPVCNTDSHLCVGCNADEGTAGSPPDVLACPAGQLRPACVSGSCVECKADASGTNVTACTPGEPVCYDPDHNCVQCTSNTDCTGTNGICDLGSHTCAPGCATDDNCAFPTPRCKTTVAVCVECLDFNDCKDPSKPTCNTNQNRCVECVNDTQCGGTKPFCNTTDGICQPCNGDFGSGATFACKSSDLPACQPNGACGACSATNEGKCLVPTTACDTSTGNCVECTSNAECIGSKPICDTVGHKCVACNGDLGSGASAACFATAFPACAISGIHQGQCVECRSTNHSACTTALPQCDPVNDVCVQCNADPDCTGANGKCDLSTHKCTTGCATDQNCTDSAPVCSNGICVECTATNQDHCAAPKPKCDTATSTCVGCTTSSECPASAPICSTTTHTCTTDCTKSSECPESAPICNPGTGKCVSCVDDAQCTTPNPKCDLTTGHCVPLPDAGAPDAGPTDAGTDGGKDAGLDAGGFDGGGGIIDAGPKVDSGTPEPGCQTDSECPTGDLCSPVTKTCVKDNFSVEGGGCSCRTEAPRGIDAGALLGFGFVGALTWRRRRNRQGAGR